MTTLDPNKYIYKSEINLLFVLRTWELNKKKNRFPNYFKGKDQRGKKPVTINTFKRLKYYYFGVRFGDVQSLNSQQFFFFF